MTHRLDSTPREPVFEELASEAEAAAVSLNEAVVASASVAEQVQDFHNTAALAEQDLTRGESPRTPQANTGATIIDFAAEAEKRRTEQMVEVVASTPGGPMRFSEAIYAALGAKRVA